LRVRVSNSQATLPYDYSHALDARICNDHLGIDNEWYDFADNVRFGSASCYGTIIDLGDKYATFLDYGLNHRLLIKGEISEDTGKQITFSAIGEHGDRIEIVGRVGGDHEEVTFNPWIKYYRTVSKDPTIGRVRVYIFDPNREVKIICAIYEGGDLAPRYRRYRVPHGAGYMYLKAKRRYRPLLLESEAIEFSTDAMIQACIAITHRRSKNIPEYTASLNLAVEHENQILKDDKPQSGGRLKLTRQKVVTNLLDNDSGTYYRR
jgi:hypothetical protein